MFGIANSTAPSDQSDAFCSMYKPWHAFGANVLPLTQTLHGQKTRPARPHHDLRPTSGHVTGTVYKLALVAQVRPVLPLSPDYWKSRIESLPPQRRNSDMLLPGSCPITGKPKRRTWADAGVATTIMPSKRQPSDPVTVQPSFVIISTV